MSSFEYERSLTAELSGSEGRCLSIPPTTCDMKDPRSERVLEKRINISQQVTNHSASKKDIPLSSAQMGCPIRRSITAI